MSVTWMDHTTLTGQITTVPSGDSVTTQRERERRRAKRIRLAERDRRRQMKANDRDRWLGLP